MTVAIGSETSYIGALLWQTSDDAKELVKLVERDDFADPRCAGEFELIRKLVDIGKRPDPHSVVHLGIETGTVRGDDRIRKLSLHIIKMHAEVPVRHKDIAREYRVHLLTDSLKRALHRLGQRVEQAAETEPEDIVFDVLLDEMDHVRGIEHRRNLAKGIVS